MAARRKKTDTCPEHYPDGIPEGVDGVGCEHGTWSRTAKASDPKTGEGSEGDGEGQESGDGEGSGE